MQFGLSFFATATMLAGGGGQFGGGNIGAVNRKVEFQLRFQF